MPVRAELGTESVGRKSTVRGRVFELSKKNMFVDSHWCSEPGMVPRRPASCALARLAKVNRTAAAEAPSAFEGEVFWNMGLCVSVCVCVCVC